MATEERWRSRRVLATVLDALIWLSPAVVASAAVWFVAPSMSSITWYWRLLGLVGLATIAAWVTGNVVRRLLPLTSLLRLTMVFPDRAPSRFKLARSAGNAQKLMSRLTSPDATEATAAEQILSLVASLSAHDRKTRGHAERVRAYTDLLSEEVGLDEHARDRLRWAALLHDIGKLHVPAAILNKPGKLDKNEWTRLYAHPEAGAKLAAPLMPWLGEWGDAIAEHHERYDGTGYPNGIAGMNISMAGRLVAVVDSFETMTAARSYKKPMSRRDARTELANCAGTQFDPELVRAFLRISLSRQVWAMGPFTFLAELPFLRLWHEGGRLVTQTAQAAPAVIGTAAVVALNPTPSPSPAADLAAVDKPGSSQPADGVNSDGAVGGPLVTTPGFGPSGGDGHGATAPDPRSPRGSGGSVRPGADPAGPVAPDGQPVPGGSGGGGSTVPQPGPNAPTVSANDFVAYAPENRPADVAVLRHVSGSPDPSTLSVLSQPNGSTVSVSGNKLTAVPDKDFVGTGLFDYRICTAGGTCDTGTVTLRVLGQTQHDADLRGADLSGLDLHGFHFERADLSGADLSGANLTQANLKEADLSDADLSNANAHDANLEHANVYGTDFSGTDMSGANLNSDLHAIDDLRTVQIGEDERIAVLNNDEAPNCPLDPSSVTIKNQPDHGTVTVHSDGTITYRAPAGTTANDDEFEYTVANEFGKTDNAKVKITLK